MDYNIEMSKTTQGMDLLDREIFQPEKPKQKKNQRKLTFSSNYSSYWYLTVMYETKETFEWMGWRHFDNGRTM